MYIKTHREGHRAHPERGTEMSAKANTDQTATLARLIRAFDKHHPVTITYTKADGTETIRTIEIYDVTTSKAGDILIKAMDRQSGESRTFRLDRIAAYTVHRTAYRVPRLAVAAPAGHGLAAARVAPVTLAPAASAEHAVTVLANLLAA